MFSDLFDKYTNTVAIGPYLSCEFAPHIQSFMIAVDRRGLSVLRTVYRCPYANEDKSRWVPDIEVKLGTRFLEAGYEMRSLLAIYSGAGAATEHINSASCVLTNPTYGYPISTAERKEIYLNDNKAVKYKQANSPVEKFY